MKHAFKGNKCTFCGVNIAISGYSEECPSRQEAIRPKKTKNRPIQQDDDSFFKDLRNDGSGAYGHTRFPAILPASPSPSASSQIEGNGFRGYYLLGLGLVGLLFLLGNCSRNSGRTDGVYESAIQKIDAGKTDELTKREAERIRDVMFWCKICDEPLSSCKHSK